MREHYAFVRVGVAAVAAALGLCACALVGPPYATARRERAPSPARSGTIEQPAAAGEMTPPAGPAQAAAAAPPAPPHYRLGPAAQSLVADARVQQRSGNYAMAAQTLERALSIEPRNPLVWLALSRERLAGGNVAQSYGMARKALYLASGDAAAQASAWGQIAAALRAEGRTQAALAAEQKAAQLSMQ